VVRATAGQSAAEVARELLDAVRAHAGGSKQADDITIVLLRRAP
jgi:serine phosphatase RsbU (regulator of sigma subunit)